jgi:hypothetical protein
MFNALLQTHSGSWIVLVILFLISAIFPKQKISLMLQRLFYLIMIVSGAWMLTILEFPKQYVIKGILALVLMATMELIVMNRRKGRPTAIAWIILVVFLVLVLLLAYKIIKLG